MEEALILIGASVRAAAFSALRAGYRPWCADLFGDVDLRQRCPVETIAAARYPEGVLELLDRAPPGPIVYTGALENAPALLAELQERRALWGNGPEVVSRVRRPEYVETLLRRAGLPVPATVPGATGRWLLKPRAGAAGVGIRFWDGQRVQSPRHYFQEFIDGESGAALFVGARFLGASRQLIGMDWLHAGPFRYCGSVGPWGLSASACATLAEIGRVLASAGLRGLYGVDFVLRDDVPFPVEVNPRYTASVEVLEYATGVEAMSLHCDDFRPSQRRARAAGSDGSASVAKAVYFAPWTFPFPSAGPWLDRLDDPPAFADIPAPGEVIERGHPVLTLFADDVAQLRHTAATLDRLFAASHTGESHEDGLRGSTSLG